MSTPQILLKEYGLVLAGSSTEAIKQAEKNLLQLQMSPTFIPDNIRIMTESTVPNSVKKLVGIYLNKYSKRINKQQSQPKAMQTLELYLGLLASSQVDFDLKPLVVVAIDSIISYEAFKAIKTKMNQNYSAVLKEALQQPDKNSVNYAYLAFYGQSLLGTHSYSEDVRDLLKSCFGEVIVLALALQTAAGELSLENRDQTISILKLIKEYSVLIRLFMKRLALLDIQVSKFLFLFEYEQLISSVLTLSPNGNESGSNIYVVVQDIEMNKLYNRIKSNYVIVFTSFVRLMCSFIKQPKIISTNPLYAKVPGILDNIIKSSAALLQAKPYYELPKVGLVQVLDEVFTLLVATLRINDFYPIFEQNKSEIIEKMILPCLSLTPHDIDNFYDNPPEFVNQVIQIVDGDIKAHPVQMGSMQEEDDIQQYETLKTCAAELLSTLCKFQDGTLSQIFDFALNVIQGKVGSPFPKSLMLLLLSILRSNLKSRTDLKQRVAKLIIELIETLPVPVVNENQRKVEDIEYAYLLLALTKTILAVKDSFNGIVPQAYKLATAVIQSSTIGQTHRFFILELFDELTRMQEGEQYALDIINIFNHLFKTPGGPSLKLLDSYFILIKYNQDLFKKQAGSVVEGIQILCLLIEQEVNKPDPHQLFLNKCWNIVREVGESDEFIPALIPQIEQAVLPLVPYVDGVRNFDFEQDILLLLTSFIERGKAVTIAQQKMFQIIPKVFYEQYFCRFGHAFHTIQIFIFYGADLLLVAPPAIQAIIDMAIASLSQTEYRKKPINEAENCQGVMLLQSLVMKCYPVMTLEQWTAIINALVQRLGKRIAYPLLSSNIYALIALALVFANKFFTDEQNDILLTRVLSNIKSFNQMQYSPKVAIAGLSQLLVLYDRPFIKRRFSQILDIAVTMLQLTTSKKQTLFDDEEEEDENEYNNSIIMVKNDFKTLDQFKYFKDQVLKVKNNNTPLLACSINELPQAKRDFLNDILRVERVLNEPRKIFKIKR